MFLTSLRQILLWTLICGCLYPLTMIGLGQLAFSHQANGSMLADGKGSQLVGQNFQGPEYFWGRLSATGDIPYNSAASAGSNFGPNEPKLKAMRGQALARHGEGAPEDLLTASGSGLDPHISPQAARYQVERVARSRGLEASQVAALVEAHVQGKQFGVLGNPRINVLQLNLALDLRSSENR